MPTFEVKKLDKFPKLFTDFFESTLKIKDKLVLMNSIFKIEILGETNFSGNVIIGKDGWLFMAGAPLKTYQHINSFSRQQLDSLKMILNARTKWLNERGIKFYVAIAPNKHEIYPEHLPSNIYQLSNPGRTDQLMAYMKNDTAVPIIDLRKILLQHKRPIPLYYKTDNHWNYLGAYYAYTEIINRIRKDFPSVGPTLKRDDFRIDSNKVEAGGEAMQINMEEWFYERRINMTPKFKEKAVDGQKQNYEVPYGFPYPWDYEVVKETKNDSLPTVVFIRDSFTDFMITYLKEHFRKSVYIFDYWRYAQNKKIIANEKPKIVVLILLDSAYNTLLKLGLEP